MTRNTSLGDLGRGTGPANGAGSTSVYGPVRARLYGPEFPPPDLLVFVRGSSERDAVRALGLGKGTIQRLRHACWPSDPRKIMRAWEHYQARHGVITSSWFLRRVRPGGVVRHAGRDYTATQLAARTGQLLAVARDAGGGLMAQTLELPAERVPLAPVGGD